MDRLRGPWSGEYVCNQGRTGLTLTIGRGDPGDVSALFHFYAAPGNARVPTGCFEMTGSYDPASGRLELKGGRWHAVPVHAGLRGMENMYMATVNRFTSTNADAASLSQKIDPNAVPPHLPSLSSELDM